jgi:hypothetical protein
MLRQCLRPLGIGHCTRVMVGESIGFMGVFLSWAGLPEEGQCGTRQRSRIEDRHQRRGCPRSRP